MGPRVTVRVMNAVGPALLALVAVGGCRAAPPRQPERLLSHADRTGYVETGRYAEARALCHEFARQYPAQARCDVFGTSPEGRDLLALVVSRDGHLTPRAAVRAGRPVVLVQAGIHAGEIDGKDAGTWFLREQLAAGAPLLGRATMVFLPMFNVDGHERFGPNHRPNQRGPAQMGWRTTAQNLNLNRDYVKADAPEMRAWLALWQAWRPHVLVDLHATDGAKFQHDIAVMVHPCFGRADALGRAACALSDALQERLRRAGHLPLPFYPAFDVDGDPASGFTQGDPPPRFSNQYAAEAGSLGVLVETHSWRPYKERVASTKHTLEALFAEVALHGDAWQGVVRSRTVRPGAEVTLMSAATDAARTIEFLGYRYTRTPSEVSGGLWTRYDDAAPEVWSLPMRDTPRPSLIVTAPRLGYVLGPGPAAATLPVLRAHGIEVVPLAAVGLTITAATQYVVTRAALTDSFEGRTRPTLTGDWQAAHALPAAGWWVRIDQPAARLVLHLLEPTAPDSFAAWGFFNAYLERKEYLEAYLTEEFARELLRDPAVAAAYDAWKADPAHTSPEARLRFFEERHPSWDARMGVLPVWKVDAAVPAGPDKARGKAPPR